MLHFMMHDSTSATQFACPSVLLTVTFAPSCAQALHLILTFQVQRVYWPTCSVWSICPDRLSRCCASKGIQPIVWKLICRVQCFAVPHLRRKPAHSYRLCNAKQSHEAYICKSYNPVIKSFVGDRIDKHGSAGGSKKI